MKLKNISTRSISVVDPFLARGVTIEPGQVGELSDPVGTELLRDCPSDWEAADVKPTTTKQSKKES